MVADHLNLLREILDAKMDAEFQFRFASETANRLQKFDQGARIAAASFTILASFAPRLIENQNAFTLTQTFACMAALAALFVSIPKWSTLHREAIAERDRWIVIFTEAEQLDARVRISGDYEKAFAEFEGLQKRIADATRSKCDMPRNSKIKDRCEKAIRDKYKTDCEQLDGLVQA